MKEVDTLNIPDSRPKFDKDTKKSSTAETKVEAVSKTNVVIEMHSEASEIKAEESNIDKYYESLMNASPAEVKLEEAPEIPSIVPAQFCLF